PAEASFEVVEPTLPPVEPPTEPPTQPPADTDSPRLTLKAKKRQSSNRRVILKITCSEACSATATAKVVVPKTGRKSKLKTYRFKKKQLGLTANSRSKLVLKLGKRPARAVRQSLRRGKKLKVRIRVSAKDAAGNQSSSRLKLKLRSVRR
ncbi:MAG: hypothetical protein WBW44_11455, partial [Solirubrobacterales bacterium]